MAGWSTHTGRAVVLPFANVDTDQLIPARFMSVSRAEGYGDYLLHDMRRDADGTPLADFPLNRHTGASILISRANFGSGSSREAAVYALVDAGIRAVIAPSFGDIFAANAANNGLLTAQLSAEDCTALERQLGTQTGEVTITLDPCQIALNDTTLTFALKETTRTKLIKGWDDIDMTQSHLADIATFRDQRHQNAPWAWPGP